MLLPQQISSETIHTRVSVSFKLYSKGGTGQVWVSCKIPYWQFQQLFIKSVKGRKTHSFIYNSEDLSKSSWETVSKIHTKEKGRKSRTVYISIVRILHRGRGSPYGDTVAYEFESSNIIVKYYKSQA